MAREPEEDKQRTGMADPSAIPAARRPYLGRTPSSSSAATAMNPTMMTSQIHRARPWNPLSPIYF